MQTPFVRNYLYLDTFITFKANRKAAHVSERLFFLYFSLFTIHFSLFTIPRNFSGEEIIEKREKNVYEMAYLLSMVLKTSQSQKHLT